MSQTYTPSAHTSYQVTIPTLSDTADIVKAFEDYHDDVAAFFADKAPLASPVFTGSVTFGSGATITLPTGSVTTGAIADGAILNADINASAAIADTKLATIATSGKVSNSATTATNLNTASAIVARDSSGNFTAGTITADLSGTATNATNGANYSSGFSKITVSSSQPSGPSAGDIWIQTA